VALVDIGLPGIDGYEVARRLREDPATRAIRLIALTGYGLAEDQRRVLEAGFDLHLVKPVDLNQLLEQLAAPLPEARNQPAAAG
jgi:CheY-like chemotaxis protein